MKRIIRAQRCRQSLISRLRRRQRAVIDLLRHATIVSDPEKMTRLNAAAASVKARRTLGNSVSIVNC